MYTYTNFSWQPLSEVISRDEETKKIKDVIDAGMQSNAKNLQNYLSTWDNYREIWEIHKDAFIRRYQRLNPQVSSFDADIYRCVVAGTKLTIKQINNDYYYYSTLRQVVLFRWIKGMHFLKINWIFVKLK